MIRVQTWAEAPEDHHPEWKRRPPAAICISGGGSRSLAAGMGQLRELQRHGLLDCVRYLSCVSGGGWAGAPFTYWSAGPSSDADLLGPYTAPEHITLAGLDQLPSTRLASGAPEHFGLRMVLNMVLHLFNGHEVWDLTVTEVFLAQFGISLHQATTASASDIERIQNANPGVDLPTFTLPRADRPCLLLSTTLSWPNELEHAEQWVQFTASPLSIGVAGGLKILTDEGQTRTVGGGYIETWAFGCGAPASPASPWPANPATVEVAPPSSWTGIGDLSGMGSSAYATTLDRFSTWYSPARQSWPLPGGTAHTYPMNDGGTLDNYAILPLLSRDVERILLFINSYTELGMAPPREIAANQQIDPYLPAMFGITDAYPHNQVFDSSEYDALVRELQRQKFDGKPVVATTKHVTLANPWWGVAAGKTVEITWVYNDAAQDWQDRLSLEVQAALTDGTFPNFPFYKTAFEPGGGLLGLPARDVNLLADLSAWVVREKHAHFRRALEGDT